MNYNQLKLLKILCDKFNIKTLKDANNYKFNLVYIAKMLTK